MYFAITNSILVLLVSLCFFHAVYLVVLKKNKKLNDTIDVRHIYTRKNLSITSLTMLPWPHIKLDPSLGLRFTYFLI